MARGLMADGSEQGSSRGGVLGLKAQAAQRAFEARGMSPAKALRRALSRSADVLWDLALVCQSVHLEMLDQDGVIAALAPGHLLLLLDGPDGAVGLVAVDREVLAGVVEVQTIQQVTTLPADAERILTATDAAMMAPLVDDMMERFARNLDAHPLRPQLEGYHYGAMVEDSRAASLLLDAPAYRAFEVTLDLALGRRKGVIRVILPDRPAQNEEPSESMAMQGPGPHEAAMSRLPVRLDAVLTRVVLPLGRAQALKPGDLLRLSPDALDGAMLLASRGQRVAGGRLGQLNGMRAVRLNWPQGAPAPPGPPESAPVSALPALGAPLAVSAPRPAPSAEPETLPDLPPLDFAEASMEPAGYDMDVAPDDAEGQDFALSGTGFAGAPFDFEE